MPAHTHSRNAQRLGARIALCSLCNNSNGIEHAVFMHSSGVVVQGIYRSANAARIMQSTPPEKSSPTFAATGAEDEFPVPASRTQLTRVATEAFNFSSSKDAAASCVSSQSALISTRQAL